MAFAPLALTMPQYDRTLYAAYWLKAYNQGTTTPLNMATDATGGTTLVKAELDTQGFPLTAGSARFIPFIDGDYDIWLFPTEAEADANDTTNAIQLADNLNADPDSTGQLSLWDTNLTYNIPEIILGSDDNYYRTIIDSNSGNNPTSSPVQWELLSFGRIWNTNITYAIDDSAYGSDGFLYIARVSQSGNDPISDIVNWWPDGGLASETVVATTSGTEINFTDIPTWVKKITIMLNEVSLSAGSSIVLRLGDSDGIETSGYTGGCIRFVLTASSIGNGSSFNIVYNIASAADTYSGVVTLALVDAATNTWTQSGNTSLGTTGFSFSAGAKALTGTLDRIQLWAGGAITFDAGSANVLYEG